MLVLVLVLVLALALVLVLVLVLVLGRPPLVVVPQPTSLQVAAGLPMAAGTKPWELALKPGGKW